MEEICLGAKTAGRIGLIYGLLICREAERLCRGLKGKMFKVNPFTILYQLLVNWRKIRGVLCSQQRLF